MNVGHETMELSSKLANQYVNSYYFIWDISHTIVVIEIWPNENDRHPNFFIEKIGFSLKKPNSFLMIYFLLIFFISWIISF